MRGLIAIQLAGNFLKKDKASDRNFFARIKKYPSRSVGTPGAGGLNHYLNDLNEAVHNAPPPGLQGGSCTGVPSSLGTLVETGVDNLAPMHSSLNNNNNMVSAGPSPSSSISPLQRFLEI